jgi:uncharacterized protein YgbK (DUF1537 family)
MGIPQNGWFIMEKTIFMKEQPIKNYFFMEHPINKWMI